MTREIIVDVLRGYDEVRSIGEIADEIVRRLAEVQPACTVSVIGAAATNVDTQWRKAGAMKCTEICAIIRSTQV